MIVISDTSPLRYLITLGQVELLPQLFEQVIIPEAIAAELRDTGAPAPVQQWIKQAPDWLEIVPDPHDIPEVLHTLHQGEQAAIALALQKSASLLIVDEKAARRISQTLDIPVTGVLGVLKLAAKRRLINPSEVVQQLKQTNFRVSKQLLKQLLDLNE